MSPKAALLGALVVLTVVYIVVWALQVARSRGTVPGDGRPSAFDAALGFLTDFFDTLGIGSFAPTTSVFKLQHGGGWNRLRGRAPSYVLFGFVTGLFAGYLLRADTPAGHLPFVAVVTRGHSLTAAEAPMLADARAAFVWVVGLAVAGALLGWIIAAVKNRKGPGGGSAQVLDEHIPGTLNAGHTLPTIAEALVFILVVNVGFTTLITLIAASVLGGWLGAGIVARWPRRKVQIGMGLALLAAAALFVIKNLDEMRGTPIFAGGDATALHGTLLAVGIVGNFTLGALMTLGIGLYAPCLIMISLLGMNPRAAFPIMMGSCAFLMPVASLRFIRKGSYNLRAALGLTIGGIPGVLLAALIVKSLPLTAVRWLVVLVVLYAATAMLRSAMGKVQVVSPSASDEATA
ncbi:MAG TPA: sulfite exporter TauE/SafE family protein [Gemmatimonadaceae bacterium]|nr:sulfite exporter TauE/SafE family protein [Gemmatimonadaceae bacterium]